jgi:outer membrane protein assembly factor BamB
VEEVWRSALPLTRPGDRLHAEWLTSGAAGDRLTGITVGYGMAFVAAREEHRLVALDATTGKQRWAFTAGGRLDAPPTLHDGLCLLGCRDGWVYALRAGDGALAWKFRAAPGRRDIVAFGQLESAWPLLGGVVVEGGVLYCVAGRSTELDGGLFGYALEPRTGEVLWKGRGPRKPSDRDPNLIGGSINQMGILNIQSVSFGGWDLKLVRPRKPVAGERMLGGANPFDRYWHFRIKRKSLPAQHHGGFLAQMIAFAEGRRAVYVADNWRKNREDHGKIVCRDREGEWEVKITPPMQVEALVLTKDAIVAGGPTAYLKRDKGFLKVLSAKDGSTRGDFSLAAPVVSDGVAVGRERLFVATNDGLVLCYGVP